jgi:hypothetical protein
MITVIAAAAGHINSSTVRETSTSRLPVILEYLGCLIFLVFLAGILNLVLLVNNRISLL